MQIMGMDASAFGSTTFLLILDLLLAIIPARIARNKGYSFAGFYIFGVVLFIAALIVALVIKDRNRISAQEMIDYKRLKDSGVISESEYQEKLKEFRANE